MNVSYNNSILVKKYLIIIFSTETNEVYSQVIYLISAVISSIKCVPFILVHFRKYHSIIIYFITS